MFTGIAHMIPINCQCSYLRVIYVRFVLTGVFTPGILMIVQVYFGNNQVWSVLIFTAALTLNGAVTGGYLGNGLDIAPNFSGIYAKHCVVRRQSNKMFCVTI